jgi:hypothetical protein
LLPKAVSDRLWEFNILKHQVTDLNAKTTILENRAGNGPTNRSVEDDLKRHFAVLYVLSQKFEDYRTIPTIPVDCQTGYR